MRRQASWTNGWRANRWRPASGSVSPVGIVARGSTEILATADDDVGRRPAIHPRPRLRSDRAGRRRRATGSTKATLRRRFKVGLGTHGPRRNPARARRAGQATPGFHRLDLQADRQAVGILLGAAHEHASSPGHRPYAPPVSPSLCHARACRPAVASSARGNRFAGVRASWTGVGRSCPSRRLQGAAALPARVFSCKVCHGLFTLSASAAET